MVVGYLHKVVPAEQERMVASLLFACKTWDMLVVLIAPAASRDKAKKLLGDAGSNIRVVAPEEVEGEVRKHL